MVSYFKFLILFISFSIFSVLYSNEIALFQFKDIHYISASEFCETQNYDCISYAEKGKIKIKFSNGDMILSINSSFVNFNQTTYHMMNKVQLQNNEFYIPAQSFAYLCSQLNVQSISIDRNKKKAIIAMPFNLSHYTIDETDISYIINIFSYTLFPDNKLSFNLLDQNKLEILFNNSSIDENSPKNKPLNNKTSITQQKDDVILLFESPQQVLNYSYSIQPNKIEVIVTKPLYTKNDSDWEIKTIIIDPGHGGKDPGAIGYHNIKEKHIVLDISKELGDLINQKMPKMEVIYTRDDDTFLGLKNRTSIANKNNGHIFISIHANSSSAKSARGCEIYLLQPNSVDDAIDVAIRENASIAFEEDKTQYNGNQMIATLAQNTFLKESEKLAVFIQEALKKELPKTRNRGIKQAGFHVLIGASMPNLLIEVGFLTNKSEAQLLNKSYYRAQIAKAIFEGIQAYVEFHN